jgi:hypothetical protein
VAINLVLVTTQAKVDISLVNHVKEVISLVPATMQVVKVDISPVPVIMQVAKAAISSDPVAKEVISLAMPEVTLPREEQEVASAPVQQVTTPMLSIA